jgi:RNA polymerase sigma-70 factor (ECF subfamily)
MPSSTELSTTISRLQLCFERFAAGDQGARDELVTIACRRLQETTKRMLRDFPGLYRWEESDDVFQNAILRLCQALEQQSPSSVRAFFGLASLQIRRELSEMIRHYVGPEGPGGRHAAPATVPSTHHPHPADFESEYVTDDPRKLAEWSELHQEIGRLPDNEREVMELLWYHDLTHQDAAHVMDVDVRSVKRYWQAARLTLHGRLRGERPPG